MQKNNLNLKFLVLILLFALAGENLLAKEFQVELVFFEHLNNSPSSELEAHVDYDPEATPFLVKFNTVDKENLQLSNDAQRIRGSRNFRLLKHVAWSQEGLSREEAGSVNIARWIPSLQGTITLYLNRFLHLDFHIESAGVTDGEVYLLHERRRLRSKTTHYIDSPKIGILARITALEDIEKMNASLTEE